MQNMYQAYICVIIGIISFAKYIDGGPMCYDCRRIPYPRDCDRVRRCGDHEKCFTSQYITTSGGIWFDVGCFPIDRCGIKRSIRLSDDVSHTVNVSYTSDVIQEDGDIITCDQCCDGEFCNSQGCNSQPLPPLSTRGPICFSCHQQAYHHSCDVITTCKQGEICYLLPQHHGTVDSIYTTGCMNEAQCDTLQAISPSLVGKRQQPTCSGCCDHDYCNRNCSALQSMGQGQTTYPSKLPTASKNTPKVSATTRSTTLSSTRTSVMTSSSTTPVMTSSTATPTTTSSPPTSSASNGMVEPAMVSLPPVELWSTEQVIPVQGGVEYDIVVVSTKEDVGAIVISSNVVDEVTFANLATETDVTPHSGAPVKYSMLTSSLTMDSVDKWLKFRTPDTTKPFMVLAYELLGSGSVQALGPFGQRAAAVAGCVSTPVQIGMQPFFPGMRPGDGIDNDCDGKIDEEIMNGEDDESDTAVDEDLAPGDAGPIKAIYNIGLLMAEDEAFTTPVILIDANGCPAADAISTVGHFTASDTDNTKYPHHWTLRTNNFPAFRITNKEPVWLKATVGFCGDETGLCLDSCDTGRKRRDVGNTRQPETIYMQLKIKDSVKNETATTNENEGHCLHDATFWGMVTLLLVINLTEVGLITVFTKKRIQLTK